MPKPSAGFLMFKKEKGGLLYFLAHPGGPFWKNRDKHAWGLPKGEPKDHDEEDFLKTAIREFKEEIGIIPKEPFIDLGSVKQKSGKQVFAWAFEGE